MNRSLEDILEECLRRIREGEDVESCLDRFPERAEELRPLLHSALKVEDVFSRLRPHPHFRAKLKYRLLSMPPKRVFPLWQQRWALALIPVLLLFLVGGGVVNASTSSLPDEPLYRVKLASEGIRLFFTPSPEGKAILQAKLVDRRMWEISQLMKRGKPADIAGKRLISHLQGIRLFAPKLDREGRGRVRAILMKKAAHHRRLLRQIRLRPPIPVPPPPAKAIEIWGRDWEREYERALRSLGE